MSLEDEFWTALKVIAARGMVPFHPDLILNSPGSGPAADTTRADAFTKVITVHAPVTPGVENTLEIQVGDTRDGFLDSGILIKGGSLRAIADPTIHVSGGGLGGTGSALVEGGNAGTYHVELPPGPPPTNDVTVTLTRSDNLDLGNGAGNPVTVTFTPGGPGAADVPVKAIDIPGQDPRPGRVDGVVTSDDPRYDGQQLSPWGYDIHVNRSPVANPDIGSAGENETKSFDVLVNDTDADVGDSKALLAPLGTVTVMSNNGQVNGIDASDAFTVENNQIKFTPGSLFDHLAVGDTATVIVNYTMEDSTHATASSTLTHRSCAM